MSSTTQILPLTIHFVVVFLQIRHPYAFFFNGKEKDYESGFHYYGARYYNSELSMWLSTDPMADKYPSLSPYNYCANNPVKLIDPNGMEIWIIGEDGTSYKYKKGKIYTKDNSVYTGEDAFVNQVKNDLNKLKQDGGYGYFIRQLSKKGLKHYIKRTYLRNQTIPENEENALNHIKTGSAIEYNPNLSINEGKERPNYVGLAHELSHAFDFDRGIENNTELTIAINPADRLKQREVDAVIRENIVRKNIGIELRRSYGGVDINEYLPQSQQRTQSKTQFNFNILKKKGMLK